MVVVLYVVAAYAISWFVCSPLALRGARPRTAPFATCTSWVLSVRRPQVYSSLIRSTVARDWDDSSPGSNAGEFPGRWHALAWLALFALLGMAALVLRMGASPTQPLRVERSAEFPHLPMAAYWS